MFVTVTPKRRMKKGKLAAAREAMEEQPDQEEMVCQKQERVAEEALGASEPPPRSEVEAVGSEEVAAGSEEDQPTSPTNTSGSDASEPAPAPRSAFASPEASTDAAAEAAPDVTRGHPEAATEEHSVHTEAAHSALAGADLTVESPAQPSAAAQAHQFDNIENLAFGGIGDADPAVPLVLTPAPDGVAMPGRSASSSEHASSDAHADRRVMGAAATIGGAAGMILMGPLSAAALGAAAAYTSTREDETGVVTRRAGAAYLKVADRAVDKGLEIADKAFDEGRKQIAKGLQNIDTNRAPGPLRGPLRAGLQRLHSMTAETTYAGGSEAMRQEARKMREKYPDRVPVICEKSPYCELPEIDKRKFAVPGTMLCGEFKYIVHKHVAEAMGKSLRMEQTIYVFVNGIAPKTSTPMSELYEQLRSDDGFLYIRYGAENTLGY